MPDLVNRSTPPRFEMAGVVPPYFAEQVLNALPAHIAVLDSEGAILAANSAWKAFALDSVWSTADYGIGTNYLHVCETACGEGAVEMRATAQGIRAVLRHETDFFSLEYATPPGTRWFQMMVTPLQDETLPGVVVVHQDITARHQSEENIKFNQSRLRLLASIAAEIVSRVSIEEIIAGTVRRLHDYFPAYQVVYSVCDVEGCIVITHSLEPEGMQPIAGISLDLNALPDYLHALQDQQLIAIPDVARDARVAARAKILQAENIYAMLDVPLKHPEAGFGLLSLNAAHRHEWNSHEITTVQEVAQYLAFALNNAHIQQEHIRAENALRFSNTRLNLIARVTGAVVGAVPIKEQAQELAEQVRQVFEVDSCIIRYLDGDDMVLLACAGIPEEFLAQRMSSQAGLAARVLGNLRPIAISDIMAHPDLHAAAERMPLQFRFASYAGAPLLVEARAIGIMGIYSRTVCRDFTETDLDHLQIVANHAAIALENNRLFRELQWQKEQFLQAQKMEGIGRLAGGIAHDFNNLLTAVLGYAELIAEDLPPDDAHQGYLTQIQRAGTRAADLTRQLLIFARKQVVQPRPVNIGTLALNLQNMLRPLIGEDIELSLHVPEDLWTVIADPGQCEQVLVNLVVNARDAMPEGGKIIIEASNIYVDENYLEPRIDFTPGPYVLLTISDTGIGMDEETKTHIFEPFFTTKEVGKGTGLGLATCYGIVAQAGGHISVYSELGRGTTFRIYLPRFAAEADELPEAETAQPLVGGGETILLVEDEEQVRDVAVRTLTTQGYQILSAANGLEALECAASYENDIHLLLTDVVMPQMNGKEVARQLLAARPGMRVLYMSGYTETVLTSQKPGEEETPFLTKPFSSAALARKVRETLDKA